MAADVPSLKKQHHQVSQQVRRGRPADRALVDLARAVEESCRRRKAREDLRLKLKYPKDLPVAEHRKELADAIRDNQVVIVAADTGSGKTTQIPKICLGLGRGRVGMIACTQPRRIAAVTVAGRVAEELGDAGRIVGSHIRFDKRAGPDCMVKFMTDGILLMETRRDPHLLAYDTIMIDEVHERSLNIDFLLGYVKRLVRERRDLKVIISSATLDVDRFSTYFGRAPIVRIRGTTYPVEVGYREPKDDDPDVPYLVAEAVGVITGIDEKGDILVFLTGERDIKEATDAVRGRKFPNTTVIPLLARLPVAEQRKAFQTGPERRVVIATNVAETSVTIPGIRYVVDSGLARISRYRSRTQVQRLHIEPISRASADQRKGRCGRVQDGVCLRLYSEKDFKSRPEYTDPEIRRTNLASVILTMLDIGLGDISTFPFIQAPTRAAVQEGYRELRELGAVDENRKLTPLGRTLARFPIEPRLARMLVEAERNNALTNVLVIVAGLSVDDPRLRPLDRREEADRLHEAYRTETSDFASILLLWRAWTKARRNLRTQGKLRRFCRDRLLSYRRLCEWTDVHSQLGNICRKLKMKLNRRHAGDEKIHRSVLAGLLGRIGMREDDGSYKGAHGIHFRIHPGSSLASKSPGWVMAGEIVETTRMYGRSVAEIEPEWVEPLAEGLCRYTYDDPYWEKETGFVRAPETVLLYDLPIVRGRPRHYGPISPAASRAVFILEALVRGRLRGAPGVIRQNRKMVEQVLAMENKVRRRDILVSEDRMCELYGERLPHDVFSAQSLADWLRAEPRAAVSLEAKRDDIIARDPADARAEQYPDFAEISGAKLPLSYRFEPGHPEDGVTCTVPVSLLESVTAWHSEWLVPGAFPEKLTALLRGLPKTYRRRLIPIPDTAARLAEMLTPYEKPLAEALSEAVAGYNGTEIPADAWAQKLPPHLMMRFVVIDETGAPIAEDRDLLSLVAQVERKVDFKKPVAGQGEWDRDEVTDWDFGKLPKRVNIGTKKVPAYAYPALVEEKDKVALRLFSSEDEAASHHRRGARALLMLRLRAALHALPPLPRLRTKGLVVYEEFGGDPDELVRDIPHRAAMDAGFAGDDVPRDQKTFHDCVAEGTEHLQASARLVQHLVDDLLVQAASVLPQVDRLRRDGHLEAYDDITAQLGYLIYPGFVADTPTEYLKQYPRYLQAIPVRIDRLYLKQARDTERMEQVLPHQQRWIAKREDFAELPEFVKYRWMLEEFRISVFAQKVGTAYPISAKRLESQWAKLL